MCCTQMVLSIIEGRMNGIFCLSGFMAKRVMAAQTNSNH